LPLYEYRCTVCGYSFEKIQNFSAEPERVCPKCQGVLIRPVTAPALRFEGAGWYVNDYAGKGGAKSGESAAASASDGTNGSSVTTGKESKTESKSSGADSAVSSTSSPAPAAASTTPSTTSGT
jgi:putative FmdB family regulatory protein